MACQKVWSTVPIPVFISQTNCDVKTTKIALLLIKVRVVPNEYLLKKCLIPSLHPQEFNFHDADLTDPLEYSNYYKNYGAGLVFFCL